MNAIFGLASDHAGYALKEFVKNYLTQKQLAYHDFGTDSAASCDYPDYAHKLGRAIDSGELTRGIAICGSGNGIAMALNKHRNVRAGLCWTPEMARLVMAHNHATVLVLPARLITE